MNSRRLLVVMGFVSTLPSTYFYALCAGVYLLLLSGQFKPTVNHKGGMLGFMAVCVFFQAGMLIGLIAGEPEARLFLARALLTTLVVLLFFIALDPNDDRAYHAYLVGAFSGIVVNAVAVILFAFSPEAYEYLHIEMLTGFDKGARLLRSPGLQSGTDTAGYITVMGVVLYLYLSARGIRSWLVSRKAFYLLLLTPLFCSRSSMLLAAGVVLFLLLAWRKQIPRHEKIVMAVFGSLVATAGVVLVGALLFPDLLGLEPTTELFGVPVETVYMVASGESYVDQYDFDGLFTIQPRGGPELYDNTIGKLLAGTGIVGLVAGGLVVSYMVVALLFGARREDRVFVLVYLAVYLFASSKNNYIFYAFFVAMSSVLFCRAAISRKVERRHLRAMRNGNLA